MPTKSKRTKHLEYARIKRTEKDGDTQEKLRILEEWKEKQNCQSQWMSFTARPQLQKLVHYNSTISVVPNVVLNVVLNVVPNIVLNVVPNVVFYF